MKVVVFFKPRSSTAIRTTYWRASTNELLTSFTARGRDREGSVITHSRGKKVLLPYSLKSLLWPNHRPKRKDFLDTCYRPDQERKRALFRIRVRARHLQCLFLLSTGPPSDRRKKITPMPIANDIEFLAITTIKGRRWIKESYCNCWREIRASTRGSDSGQKSSESSAAKREDLWSIWKSISQRPVYCTYWLIDCIDWVSIRELWYIYSTPADETFQLEARSYQHFNTNKNRNRNSWGPRPYRKRSMND